MGHQTVPSSDGPFDRVPIAHRRKVPLGLESFTFGPSDLRGAEPLLLLCLLL